MTPIDQFTYQIKLLFFTLQGRIVEVFGIMWRNIISTILKTSLEE